MLANFKTQLVSAQQWLSSQVQLSHGDKETAERERARQIALKALNIAERACLSLDYLHSAADCFIGSLQNARQSLIATLDQSDPIHDAFQDWHLLGRVQEHLGDYSQAQECYTRAYTLLPPTGRTHAHIVRDLARFLAETSHNLDLAEHICFTAISASLEGNKASFLETDSASWHILENVEILSLTLGLKRRFPEALLYVNKARELYVRDNQPSISARLALSWALAAAGLQDREKAEAEFLRAVILNALSLGNWHLSTLRVLGAYASALWDWGRDADAASLFAECYIGHYYRLGPCHRITEESCSMLKRCTLSQYQRNIIRIFRSCSTYAELRTIAYEHMELWTIADTLGSLEGNPFKFAERLIGYLLEHPSIRLMQQTRLESAAKKIIRFQRAMAACESSLGKHTEAASRLKLLLQSPSAIRINNAMMLHCKLDTAIYLSLASKQGARDPKVQELSQFVFYEAETLLETYGEERSSLASALRKRLAQYQLTHFEWGNLPKFDVSPFRLLGIVGHGSSSAGVTSVSMNGILYAQKLTILKGTYARQLRDQTKQEVDILKRLNHPHIVHVYCTFEERYSFAMVMQPLASGDLEAFLSQKTLPLELSPLIERWLGCLALTLSFIHDHGVKHRDIKPKNILVNEGQVVFTDFGSSRDCSLETGMSTDGPAYGHTRIYSAPEVMAAEKRNASADIFSLGCVFTEMISVACGRSLGCYDLFRGSKDYRRIPYHQSLGLIEAWFLDKEEMPTWGAKMYTAFVERMLAPSPESRLSAQETAMAIRAHFKSEELATETFCRHCFRYCLDEI
jgi:serine/threonine protein kinase